jgi:hypothetical protein
MRPFKFATYKLQVADISFHVMREAKFKVRLRQDLLRYVSNVAERRIVKVVPAPGRPTLGGAERLQIIPDFRICLLTPILPSSCSC